MPDLRPFGLWARIKHCEEFKPFSTTSFLYLYHPTGVKRSHKKQKIVLEGEKSVDIVSDIKGITHRSRRVSNSSA